MPHVGVEQSSRVLPRRDTADGWSVTRVHWSDVPDYDYEQASSGVPDHDLRRELEIDWTAARGRAVYPEFGPRHQARDPLPFDPRRPLTLGWDQGGREVGSTPACVVTQLSALGQWLIYGSICPPEDETVGVWEHAREVADYLIAEFASPAGLRLQDLRLVHYGDPAGNAKPPATLGSVSDVRERRSAWDIIRRGLPTCLDPVTGLPDPESGREGFGWTITPAAPSLVRRMEVVRARLTATIYGREPALVVDPGAQEVIAGFAGGYHYHQRQDGRYELDPRKDRYADILNAVEYACSGLFGAEQREEKRDRPPRRRETIGLSPTARVRLGR